MKNFYPADEQEARIWGRFQQLTGLIVKEFDPQVHVIEPFDIDYDKYMVLESYDPHPRHKDAGVYVAVDSQGDLLVVDEFYKNVNESEAAVLIKQKRENKRVVRKLIDPSAFNKDQHSGYSYGLALNEKYKLGFEPGSKARHEAIKLIKEHFSFIKQGGKFPKPPKVYVFSNCTQFIYEITHWQWEEWKGANKYEKAPKETPEDKGDHLMECFGRILLDLTITKWRPAPIDRANPLFADSATQYQGKRKVYA